MILWMLWIKSFAEFNFEPKEESCLGALGLFGFCAEKIAGVFLFLLVAVFLFSPGPSFAQASTLQSVLTWQDSDTTDSVQIDKAPASSGPWATLSTVAPGVLTYTDATNAPGQTACYRVENFNSSGNGPSSNVVCKTFPSVPTVAPVLSIK